MTELYIIVLHKESLDKDWIACIESVWSTLALAKAAVLYHSFHAHIEPERYAIIIRKLNAAHND